MRIVLLLCLQSFRCGCVFIRATAGNSSDNLTNLSSQREDVGANRSGLSFGDLTCMGWTGGSCSVFACHADRGPVACQSGYCMCRRGTCANAEGVCVMASGKWIGEYAIKFRNAHNLQRSYLGDVRNYGRLNIFDTSDVTHRLVMDPVPNPRWKIALSPTGHVRIESKLEPGHVMAVWENRRRRSDSGHSDGRRRGGFSDGRRRGGYLQQDAGFSDGRRRGSFSTHSDDSEPDYWPVLISFERAHPLDVTFRVRWTSQDGGGLEIWDPQTGHALAAYEPGFFGSWNRGPETLGVCGSAPGWLSFLGGCTGRQLVVFEPPLPSQATSRQARHYIYEISSMNWWQLLLALVLLCGCLGGCGLIAASTGVLQT